MKLKILIFSLIISISAKVTKATPVYQAFDKRQFYNIVKSGSAEDIDNEIYILGNGTIIEKNAFIGTLLMKKADLVSSPKNKLSLFKAGRTKLETAIASDSSNVEYHFLRMIIEEHAPKIVKYNSLLAADAGYVRRYFRKLPLVVQTAVLDYSKTSEILTTENLKSANE